MSVFSAAIMLNPCLRSPSPRLVEPARIQYLFGSMLYFVKQCLDVTTCCAEYSHPPHTR